MRGWPTPKTWTIQHLIVDPEVRLRGIGKRIVASVELDALSSTDTTSAIVAVPVSSSNDSFWEHNGFERAGEKSIELSGNEYSFGIFKKTIR